LYDVAPKQTDQALFAKVDVGGVAMHITTKSTFGSLKTLFTNHHVDFNKYVADIPLSKLDPFTTGVYVMKCVNENLFPDCKQFWNAKTLICLWVWFLIKLECMEIDSRTDTRDQILWSVIRKTV